MRHRRLDPELLDTLEQDPDELDESLVMVAQVNRWLGGLRSIVRALSDFRDRPCRILDLGSGNGDTGTELTETPGSGEWTVVGLDLSELTTSIARVRHPDGEFLVGDALALPFASDAFDVVVSFLTLHHFDDEEAVRFLAEMGRVANARVLVSDLERHRLNFVGARLLAATVWRGNRLTRNDGPLSVLKSFRPDELASLGTASGLRGVGVRRTFPFRLTLTGQPPA